MIILYIYLIGLFISIFLISPFCVKRKDDFLISIHNGFTSSIINDIPRLWREEDYSSFKENEFKLKKTAVILSLIWPITFVCLICYLLFKLFIISVLNIVKLITKIPPYTWLAKLFDISCNLFEIKPKFLKEKEINESKLTYRHIEYKD